MCIGLTFEYWYNIFFIRYFNTYTRNCSLWRWKRKIKWSLHKRVQTSAQTYALVLSRVNNKCLQQNLFYSSFNSLFFSSLCLSSDNSCNYKWSKKMEIFLLFYLVCILYKLQVKPLWMKFVLYSIALMLIDEHVRKFLSKVFVLNLVYQSRFIFIAKFGINHTIYYRHMPEHVNRLPNWSNNSNFQT